MNLTPEKLAKVVELADLCEIASYERSIGDRPKSIDSVYDPPHTGTSHVHPRSFADLPSGPSPSHLNLLSYLESLSDRERNDLMCLMYFGRDMEYEQINHGKPLRSLRKAYLKDIRLGPGHYGCINPDYLAGKAPLSKWIRAAVAAMPDSLVWWRYKKALRKQQEKMTMALQAAYR